MKLKIGPAIRFVRKQRGLSQNMVSERSGIPRSYLCRVERGVLTPGLENIARLSYAMDLEPYKLVRMLYPKGANSSHLAKLD